MSEQNKAVGPLDSFFLFLAAKFDGYKTISGIVLIVGGAATIFFTPDYKEAGYNMIATGVTMLIVGLSHKAVKKAKAT